MFVSAWGFRVDFLVERKGGIGAGNVSGWNTARDACSGVWSVAEAEVTEGGRAESCLFCRDD